MLPKLLRVGEPPQRLDRDLIAPGWSTGGWFRTPEAT